MKVLLSIKPEFANMIFSGTKQFEFRKVLFRRSNITTIIVYSSFPVQRVIGEFSVEAIFSDSPKAIWEKTHSMAGITKKYFFSYFEKHNKAVAIKIGCAKRYRTAKSLSDFSLSNAPQSFVYIEE